jgi:hypothetical protein
LYVDGQLVQVGKVHNTEEKAFAMLGVTQVVDDAFMRGQTHRDGVAQTTEEITAYVADRDAATERAARLRAEAEALESRFR